MKEQNNNIGLDNLTYNNLKQLLANRESSNNQYLENSLGYIGKYQFGAAALADTGFINKNKYQKAKRYSKWQKDFLADDSNWLIPGGKQEFMNNIEIQELAMDKLLAQNAKTLKRLIPDKVKTQQELSSNLAAAHLKGVGGVKNYHKTGINSTDAYGTGIEEYFILGSKATQGTEVKGYGKQSNSADFKSSIKNSSQKQPNDNPISRAESSNNTKSDSFLDSIIRNSQTLVFSSVLAGSIFKSGFEKASSAYDTTKSKYLDIKDYIIEKFNSNADLDPAETEYPENETTQINNNLGILNHIASNIAENNSTLTTAIRSAYPNAVPTDIKPVLERIADTNRDIYSVLHDFYEDSFDEQDTGFRNQNSINNRQLAAIADSVAEAVSINQNSANFNESRNSGGLFSTVTSILSGLLGGLAVIPILKYIGKVGFKTVKWVFGLTFGKILNMVWDDITRSSVWRLISDSSSGFKWVLSKVNWLISAVGELGAKIGAMGLKAANSVADTAKNSKVVSTVKSAANSAWDFIKNAGNKIADKVSDIKDKAITGGKNFINNVSEQAGNIYNKSKSFIAETYDKTTSWLKDKAIKGLDKLKTVLGLTQEALFDKLKPAFAKFLNKEAFNTLKYSIKKVPILGLAIGSGLSIQRLMAGDKEGAALEMLSGLASTLPGYGTAASLGIDAAIIARDNNLLKLDSLKQDAEEAYNLNKQDMRDIQNVDDFKSLNQEYEDLIFKEYEQRKQQNKTKPENINQLNKAENITLVDILNKINEIQNLNEKLSESDLNKINELIEQSKNFNITNEKDSEIYNKIQNIDINKNSSLDDLNNLESTYNEIEEKSGLKVTKTNNDYQINQTENKPDYKDLNVLISKAEKIIKQKYNSNITNQEKNFIDDLYNKINLINNTLSEQLNNLFTKIENNKERKIMNKESVLNRLEPIMQPIYIQNNNQQPNINIYKGQKSSYQGSLLTSFER